MFNHHSWMDMLSWTGVLVRSIRVEITHVCFQHKARTVGLCTMLGASCRDRIHFLTCRQAVELQCNPSEVDIPAHGLQKQSLPLCSSSTMFLPLEDLVQRLSYDGSCFQSPCCFNTHGAKNAARARETSTLRFPVVPALLQLNWS